MSETVFRDLCRKEEINIFSAGVDPWPHVHPLVAALMKEKGLSMEGQQPEHVNTYKDIVFDYVITIGDPARAGVPDFPKEPVRFHWNISDPALGKDAKPEDIFRSTLHQLEKKLIKLREIIINTKL